MKNKKQWQLKKISIAVILVLSLTIVIINAQNMDEEIQTSIETPNKYALQCGVRLNDFFDLKKDTI